MLNTHNNIGTLDTSDVQIKYILELIHQINIRIPSLLFDLSTFMDVIIDEDCLLGNPWGHKYIHKSGELIKDGKYAVYYSSKHDYYVIESKPIIPLGILRKVSKGKNVVNYEVLCDIGRKYVLDLTQAFSAIDIDRGKRGNKQYLKYDPRNNNVDLEISQIASAILYYSPDYYTARNTGVRHDSKYRAPLTMMLTMLYGTLKESCERNGIRCLKLIEPIFHYPKHDMNMSGILSYITMIESAAPHTLPVYHIQFCWDAIDRNIDTLKVFIPEDIGKLNGDEGYAYSHYSELNEARVYRLYNLILHLYMHEMGHTKFGLDNEEDTDAFAKRERTVIKQYLQFRCNYLQMIIRHFFINHSHFMDEVSMDN